MGQDDNVATSVAHLVLCYVGGQGISRAFDSTGFTHPGMHANCFIHGVVGFLHYQSGTFGNDFTAVYGISYMATRYLPLPCLMADLYRGNNGLASLHLLSGVVPTVMALSGNDNPPLGNLMIACNILSMCYYSAQNNREWGWYTAGAALFSYYLAPQTGNKVAYPLGLALMVYCSYRLFHSHVDAAAVPVRRR